MGHYHSEMYSDDRTPAEKKAALKKEKREEEIKKNLCKVLGITKKELAIVYEILKDGWKY